MILMQYYSILIFILIWFLHTGCGPESQRYLSNLNATKDSPLYTTYAAHKERSEFILDEGFHFLFYEGERGIEFTSDKAGDLCLAFKMDAKYVYQISNLFQEPVIHASYCDMVQFSFFPFQSVKVNATFLVYSSRLAIHDLEIQNISKNNVDIELISFLQNNYRTFDNIKFHKAENKITFTHQELPDRWVLEHGVPYADEVYDVFLLSEGPDQMNSFHSYKNDNICSNFGSAIEYTDKIGTDVTDLARIISMQKKISLRPGESKKLRIMRGFATDSNDLEKITKQAQQLLTENLSKYLTYNESLYSRIPKYNFNNPEKDLLYWSAWNLMRQVMLPAEGKCGYNYYVFSREPTWGWGHGGQVFHESLTMHAYAHMDPISAMNSQRVYLERQHQNGYINYRTGPYLDEVIQVNDEFTSSAPWYAWQNWEIYKITKDKEFLTEMYHSSKNFYNYYVTNRDKDNDGLYEWGAHAVLESVRDARVAVWDQVGWPTNFEAIDLNTMLVNETMTLAAMAEELGLYDEAVIWIAQTQHLSKLLNETFWDEESGFYYHVDHNDHDFSFNSENDLKRQEIIGFLPLWAGIASNDQARRLMEHLTNENKFWRKYGVPSLSADDAYYNDKGYWNGPVWVEWNYLIMEGMLRYGYYEQAKELVNRVAGNMIAQLKKDHNFWEFYSPDEQWAGYHKTYIWAGIINRMLIDIANL